MRKFLQGFGLGILVAALVMGISYRKSTAGAGEDIVERARELGMVFPAGSEAPDASEDETEVVSESSTDEQATSASSQAVKGAGLGADSDTETKDEKKDSENNKTAKPKTTKKPKSTQTPAPTATPAIDTSKLKTGQKVSFTVESGLLSSSVAREMKKAGIIADDTAFDHYLVENNLGRKVIAGTYELTVGASYEEIAKIITHTA